MSWTYRQRDPGLTLFTAVLNVGASLALGNGMRMLEIGCNEADWLTPASEAWPESRFVGVDARAEEGVQGRVWRHRGDARQADLFEPESFDAVISVSAIEHIGLGHYGDPQDPDGDIQAMTNAFRWLKPGGWLYFDVPYDPTGYQVLNTECRIYDDNARWERLWQVPLTEAKAKARWHWDGYVESRFPGTLVEKPTEAAPRYWYAAHVWQKC